MKYAVDDLDRQIMTALQENGRASNTQIATALGMAESTVRKRIERLIDQGVMKITAVVNPLELNYRIVAIFGLRVTPNRVTAVGDRLSQLPEFRFIGITVGAWDFITEGWFESLDQMHRFLSERLWPIEGVTRVEVSHIIKMVRYAYDWSGDVTEAADRGAVPPKLASGGR